MRPPPPTLPQRLPTPWNEFTPAATTTYSYFTSGALNNNVKTITDPSGNVFTVSYYLNDRVFRHTDALGGQTTFEYDLLHNQARVTDPRGETETMPSNVPIKLVALPEEPGTYSLRFQNLDTVPISYSLEARFTTADGFNVERISRALRYLGLAQNADGGWGIARGEDSSLMITTEVLLTLEAYGNASAPGSAIDNGVNWLVTNKRNPDGRFGSVPGTSTAYETALAILVIHGANPSSPALDPARAFLGATQLPNGSWNNDPYSTALAVRSLGLITGCILDVDGKNPCCDVPTDVVCVARHLLGLTPVPPDFRVLDPTIPPDAAVAANLT